ncbi:MAG TPA: HAMP domain-containing histidine kinase [Firmicutes bacterium]|nr:HAMP domain-containing histidine kinase [Bacillota bacterium]
MFKKSRRKIVASILSILVLLLFGTFCVIYLASYAEMTNENRRLLEQYVDTYPLRGMADAGNWEDSRAKDDRVDPHSKPPLLELSTFYSVLMSKDGQVLKVDTADRSTFDEEALASLAGEIVESGRSRGREKNLIYQMADKGDYVLVAFLDNTMMLESASTLISYTLIFGGAALVLLFFLARYLADRIVSPLEESYQRQKQFVSDAGHELKTPVAVVNANLELLSREIGENPWLSNIQYENERMSALIIQLLELARAENVTPPMETLDLSRLVCGETLPFETVAYENGLALLSGIAENVFVQGNSVQLKQLTSILLDNAIRHSDRGKEVFLSLKAEKNHAVLSVVNDGEAIPPEDRKRLFERFYRTDTARTGEGRHYGLGLAIAKAIVSAHKGSIDVQCHDGKVEFTARLPLLKSV